MSSRLRVAGDQSRRAKCLFEVGDDLDHTVTVRNNGNREVFVTVVCRYSGPHIKTHGGDAEWTTEEFLLDEVESDGIITHDFPANATVDSSTSARPIGEIIHLTLTVRTRSPRRTRIDEYTGRHPVTVK